jgi:hypothetical protein
MAWVEHPHPDEASSDYGRKTLERSLKRHRGQMSMRASSYTFPQLGDNVARIWEEAHFGETALSNVHKDMLATLVSSANACQY